MPGRPRLTRTIVAALLTAATAAAATPAIASNPSGAAPVPPDTIAQRVKACTACHAAKERGDAFFPRIAGKPAGYLYNQLVNFRDGRRQSPLMTYMVEQLPDAYLREVAEYFSEQHPSPPPARAGTVSARVLERGRALTLRGDPASNVPACAACHGAALTGVGPAIPGLLGLSPDYVNAQFGAWKNRMRHAGAPDCMGEVATRLSDADVAAVSAWLATQAAPAQARPASALAAPLPLRCGGVPP